MKKKTFSAKIRKFLKKLFLKGIFKKAFSKKKYFQKNQKNFEKKNIFKKAFLEIIEKAFSQKHFAKIRYFFLTFFLISMIKNLNFSTFFQLCDRVRCKRAPDGYGWITIFSTFSPFQIKWKIQTMST